MISYHNLPADRQPCPVCKHPTGDCVGDSQYHGRIEFLPKKIDDPRATFSVPRRIYQKKFVNGKKRKVLLYPIGARITFEEAKRIGLLPGKKRVKEQ